MTENLLEAILSFYGVEESNHPLASDLANKCDVPDRVISQFLRLIDCPENGKCLIYMEPVCDYLIRSYFGHISKPVNKQLIKDISDVWAAIKLLVQESKDMDSKSVHGCMNANPIYAFHFTVYPFENHGSEDRLSFAKTYRALAAFLHRKIFYWSAQIKQEKPGIKMDDYMGHLGLAARKAVQSSGYESKEAVFSIKALRCAAIIKRIKESKNIHGELLINAGDPTYLKDLFIRDTREKIKHKKNHRKYYGRTERWVDFEVEPVKTAGHTLLNTPENTGPFCNVDPETNNATFKYFPSPNIPSEAEESGEFDSDYIDDVAITIPPSWLSSSWEAKRRAQGQIESMVQRLKVQPWDDRCISFDGLRKVLCTIEDSEGSVWHKVQMILLFSLLMGAPKKQLIKIGCMRVPKSENDECIDAEEIADGDCWLDTKKGLMWRLSNHPTMDDNTSAYSIDIIEQFELPPLLAELMGGLPSFSKRLFSKSNFLHAEKFLNSLGLDGLSKMSLARLRLSFYAYFVNGSGFPPLYADYLSGSESFHLLSQHSYITVPVEHLVGEWHRMSERFLAGISHKKPVDVVLSEMRCQPVCMDAVMPTSESRFMGASRTPKISTIKSHLDCLWENFPHQNREIILADDHEWNTYMGYLYVFYASCTGQRPLRDPCTRQGLINKTLGLAHVSDKHNRVNKEFRDIPMCSSLVSALSVHQSVHREWMSLKRTQGYSLSGPPDAFLLADHTSNSLVPVSPRLLDELLGDSLGDRYFVGLNNGCRHLLLTLLHWADTPQELIDYMSGHRHAGTEPTNICSPSSLSVVAEQLKRVVDERVVKPLGLKQPVEDGFYG